MNFNDFLTKNKPEWFTLDHGHTLIARAIDTAATCKQDALILAPPRCGKSTIFADLLPRWLTSERKDESVIVACGCQDIADYWRKHFDALGSEDARHRVYFVGAGAALCGRGADVFILDPFSLDNHRLADWYGSTVRPRLNPGGYVLAVDSRSGNGDFASHLMRQGMSTTHVLPGMLSKTYDDGKYFEGVLSSMHRMSIWNQMVGTDEEVKVSTPASDWSNLSNALKPYLPERFKVFFEHTPLDDMSKVKLVEFNDSVETGDYLLTLKFKSPIHPHPLS